MAMTERPALPEHCWVCEKYAQCSCPDCRELRDALREALDATERGETVDLGSFAGYAEEDPVAYAQVVGGGLVKIAAAQLAKEA